MSLCIELWRLVEVYRTSVAKIKLCRLNNAADKCHHEHNSDKLSNNCSRVSLWRRTRWRHSPTIQHPHLDGSQTTISDTKDSRSTNDRHGALLLVDLSLFYGCTRSPLLWSRRDRVLISSCPCSRAHAGQRQFGHSCRLLRVYSPAGPRRALSKAANVNKLHPGLFVTPNRTARPTEQQLRMTAGSSWVDVYKSVAMKLTSMPIFDIRCQL